MPDRSTSTSRATILRFVMLYAKSRYVLPIVGVSLLVIALVGMWAGLLAPDIRQQEDRFKVQIQFATIVPLFVGSFVAYSAHSPMSEMDDAVPGLVRRLQLGFTVGVLVLFSLLGFASGMEWELDGAGVILVRNLLGWCGLTLLMRPLLGSSRSWMPAIAWAGVSLFSADRSTGDYPGWAWSMQAADNRTSTVVATACLVAGMVSLWRTPFRVRED